MPLYLVRWPTLAASLVRAQDEDELLDIHDEAADPGGCTYEVYRGPVWIDFDVPFGVRDRTPEGTVPTDPSDFVVEPTPDFDGAVDFDILTVRTPVTDAAGEMRDEVLRGAFPELAEFIDGSTSEKRAQSRIRTRGRQNSNARSVRSSGRSSSTSARDVRSRRVTTSRRR